MDCYDKKQLDGCLLYHGSKRLKEIDYSPTSKNLSTNVEINMKQPNNTILQQSSIISIQTTNNNLTHPTRIKELEKRH